MDNAMTRCQHTGSSCIHRRFEPQAARQPSGFTRADLFEVVLGTLVFGGMLLALYLWAAIAAVAG